MQRLMRNLSNRFTTAAGETAGQHSRRHTNHQRSIRRGAGDGRMELPVAVDAPAGAECHRRRQLCHREAERGGASQRQIYGRFPAQIFGQCGYNDVVGIPNGGRDASLGISLWRHPRQLV